jgi:hypothetical protein
VRHRDRHRRRERSWHQDDQIAPFEAAAGQTAGHVPEAAFAGAICFALAALGGTKKGRAGQPAVLIPLGLLFVTLPSLWNMWETAF